MKATHILGALALCLTPVAAQANHIDFISDGGFLLSTTDLMGPASASQIGDAGNILGTERDVTIDFSAGSGILSTGVIAVPPGPGPVGPDLSTLLYFDTSVGSFGTLELNYDGVGGVGLGGVDFGTLWNAISVNFAGVQGEGLLTVEVEDTSMNVGSASATIDAAGVYDFLLADPGYAGVNFNSVDRVTLTLTSTIAASDFAIAQVTRETVVPEPGTLGLLALTGLMASAVRFRYVLG